MRSNQRLPLYVGKQMWGCTMKRPEVEVGFFYHPPPQFLRQHFSLNQEHSSWLDWLASEPWGSSTMLHPVLGFQEHALPPGSYMSSYSAN